MPDRIDNIIERLELLEAKINSLDNEDDIVDTPSFDMLTIDERINTLVPSMVKKEIDKADYITKMAVRDIVKAEIIAALEAKRTFATTVAKDPEEAKPKPKPKKKAVKPRL